MQRGAHVRQTNAQIEHIVARGAERKVDQPNLAAVEQHVALVGVRVHHAIHVGVARQLAYPLDELRHRLGQLHIVVAGDAAVLHGGAQGPQHRLKVGRVAGGAPPVGRRAPFGGVSVEGRQDASDLAGGVLRLPLAVVGLAGEPAEQRAVQRAGAHRHGGHQLVIAVSDRSLQDEVGIIVQRLEPLQLRSHHDAVGAVAAHGRSDGDVQAQEIAVRAGRLHAKRDAVAVADEHQGCPVQAIGGQRLPGDGVKL